MNAAQEPHHSATTPPTGLSVGQAADAYVDTLQVPTTRRVYAQIIAMAIDTLGRDRALADVQDLDVGRMLQELWGTAAASTWNSRHSAISSWLGWCRTTGHLGPAVPQSAGRRPTDAQMQATRIHSRAEIDRLTSNSDIPVRETSLWRMLYDTVAPAAEVLGLNIEDLDLSSRSALVRSSDARRRHRAQTDSEVEVVRRRVFWGPTTERLLAQHLQSRTDGPVFLATQPPPARQALTERDVDPVTRYARLTYSSADKLLDRYTAPAGRGTGWNLHELRTSARLHHQIDQALAVLAEAWLLIGDLDPGLVRALAEDDLPLLTSAARDLEQSGRAMATAGGSIVEAVSRIAHAVDLAQFPSLSPQATRQAGNALARAMTLSEAAVHEAQAAAASTHVRDRRR